jgi:hypothetical protein
VNWKLWRENYSKCYGTVAESTVDSMVGPDLQDQLGGRHRSDSKPTCHLRCITIVHNLPSSCINSTVSTCYSNLKLINNTSRS